MQKILLVILFTGYCFARELPSFQCIDTHEASMINFQGEIKPEVKETSHRSKLNILLVNGTHEGKKYLQYLNINGNNIDVIRIYGSYVYALEFTAGGMHSWTLFDNKDGKTYITLSKTYSMMGAPLTSYSLYKCEQVNNKF